MTRAALNTTEALPGRFRSDLQGWLEGVGRRLYPYRPRLRDWRFWAVQALVVLIAGLHSAVEVIGYPPELEMLYPGLISLFFIPVIYAGLNFGYAGTVATSLGVIFFTLPDFVFWHQGLERWGVLLQVGIVLVVGTFVGHRVDREARARRQGEAAGVALKTSEAKYRGLFESSPLAVLVLDPAGTVLDANPAARQLFGGNRGALTDTAVADLIGAQNSTKLLEHYRNDGSNQPTLVLKTAEGSQVYLEPTVTRIGDSQGQPALQVVLQNVTEKWQREAGLRAYAAQMLRAQEEERKRIAQELHDDSVQALVMLCRKLDMVEGSGSSLQPCVIEGLREARKSAEEIVEGIRGFSRALRPSILEDLGLVASIRRLLTDLTEGTRAEGRLKVVGDERRLSPDIELGLFRIAQEALRNVDRHAKADRVAVTITFDEWETRLKVVDTGVGFVLPSGPSDFAVSRHLGILGMQERAKLLGGSLEIQSTLGKGTRVMASIPTEKKALSRSTNDLKALR